MMGFPASYSDLTTVIDTALLTTNTLAYDTTLDLGAKSIAKTHCGLMWQTAADYQRQSRIYILARELDTGFALLRIATELARDAYVIGKDERRLDLWLNREEQAEEYKKRFKFDQTIPEGKAAFDIYKLCSRFGVHGHTTSLLHAKSTGETTTDGNGVIMNTDERAIFSGLQIWLRTIFPIHALFCQAFRLHKAPVGEPYRMFVQLVSALSPILEGVDNKVGLRPEVIH